MYGTLSAAPLATFAAVALRPADRSRGAMTACAPAASATRRHAPRLCGSVTPSSTSNSGVPEMPSSSSARFCASGKSFARATTLMLDVARKTPQARFVGGDQAHARLLRGTQEVLHAPILREGSYSTSSIDDASARRRAVTA